MPEKEFLNEKNGYLYIELTIQAGAKKNSWAGVHNKRLRLRISSPPVDRAANKALIAFIAKELKLRKNQLSIIKGQFAKLKSLKISELSLEETTRLQTYFTNLLH